MIRSETLAFLKKLKKNNNREWFEKHRGDYEVARADFEVFVAKLISRYAVEDKDLEGLQARQCIYRIHRDIRFSKDKTPYKNHLAATLDRGGKNSGFAGYYFHLEPGESFVGAGIWNPPVENVKKIRQEIDYNLEEFESIVKAKSFRTFYDGFYTGENVQLRKLPQGYEKDNPAGEYLRFKSWMITSDVSDDLILSSKLVNHCIRAFREAKPFIDFINRAIE